MSTHPTPPASDLDLFDDEALRNPYPLYDELRALGPVVHLPHLGVYAVTRYAGVREVLTDWEVFSSAKGVGLDENFNMAVEGATITSDPPDHDVMRRVLERPLLPDALKEVEPFLAQEATKVVERIVGRNSFDAAAELAQHLPLTVVSKLVGLGDHGRQNMLEWAAASFDALGPAGNKRMIAALPKAGEMVEYAQNQARPGVIDPDGWAAGLFKAGEKGELPAEKCPLMVMDYTAPSLDTTILAIGNLVYLFAQNPDQWDRLRQKPALLRHAINTATAFRQGGGRWPRRR